ncbi:MAG TPA: ABC transporter ATP-binding protein [Nitrosopumilaceae archaeon]|nr:ABC transporter ATP-binding protein [Nitrosopumilaceae archaeon]
MESSVIKLENVSKIFDLDKKRDFYSNTKDLEIDQKNQRRLVALDKISFTVSKGETVGLIGLNGSGKTTLLRIIAGIYEPDSGLVQVNGRLAPLLQIGTGFHNELDAEENIVMYGMLLGLTKLQIKEKIDGIMEFAELKRFRNMKLKDFSTGMRARLGFATALQIDPDILLVDEVLSVGDAVFREKSFQAFLSFKQKHKSIIYTTHNINLISELSDRVILIDHGKIMKIGKPNEVIPTYKEIIASHSRPNL